MPKSPNDKLPADSDQRSPMEASALARDVMKRMLATPPTPHVPVKPKKKSKSWEGSCGAGFGMGIRVVGSAIATSKRAMRPAAAATNAAISTRRRGRLRFVPAAVSLSEHSLRKEMSDDRY